jgi:hypothetical protein
MYCDEGGIAKAAQRDAQGDSEKQDKRGQLCQMKATRHTMIHDSKRLTLAQNKTIPRTVSDHQTAHPIEMSTR